MPCWCVLCCWGVLGCLHSCPCAVHLCGVLSLMIDHLPPDLCYPWGRHPVTCNRAQRTESVSMSDLDSPAAPASAKTGSKHAKHF
jgi:hypothetical protein